MKKKDDCDKCKTYKYHYRAEFSFRPIDIICVVLVCALIVAGVASWCS